MCTLQMSLFKAIKKTCFGQPTSYLRYIHLSADCKVQEEKVPTVESDDFFTEEKPEVKVLTEEELMAKRNKSRLSPWHFKIINDQEPYEVPYNWYHSTIRYKRKAYAKFGEKSGINPGIQWPIQDDLNKRLEYESVAHPFTFQEMIANTKEKRRLEQEYFDNRTKEIEVKVAAIDKTIKEVLDKRAAKEMEVFRAQEKKEKMMEEVRRHFGYTMDPKDLRFQELLAKKEKEDKKKLKDARKLERQNKMLEGLKQKSKAMMTPTTSDVQAE